jgi:hypothetical protein
MLLTNTGSVFISSEDLLDSQVSDDDVGLALDDTTLLKLVMILGFGAPSLHAKANENREIVLSNDTGIATNSDLIGSLCDGARDNNDLSSYCELVRYPPRSKST